MVELRGPLAKVVRTLQTLQDDDWIDEHSHALFTEFAVYNPQVRDAKLRVSHRGQCDMITRVKASATELCKIKKYCEKCSQPYITVFVHW